MTYIVLIISGILFLIIYRILSKPKIKSTGQSYSDISEWADNANPEFKKTIIQDLHRIMTEGTDSSFIIIEFNNEYYIRYKPLKHNKQIFCEAVSNDFLSEKYKISSVRELKLIKKGFNPPDMNYKGKDIPKNFSKFYQAGNINHYNLIYKELEFIMTNIYKIDNSKGIQIKISLKQ